MLLLRMKSCMAHLSKTASAGILFLVAAYPFEPAQSVNLDDCPSMNLDLGLDEQNLTAEEMVLLLEERFHESTLEFEECLKTSIANSQSAQAASAANAQNAPSAIESQGEQTQPAWQAALPSSDGGEASGQSSSSDSSATLAGELTEAQSNPMARGDLESGKVPEDIPPAANDDAFMLQLRTAAIEEQDPAKQAELWNLYRKYKGLPLK